MKCWQQRKTKTVNQTKHIYKADLAQGAALLRSLIQAFFSPNLVHLYPWLLKSLWSFLSGEVRWLGSTPSNTLSVRSQHEDHLERRAPNNDEQKQYPSHCPWSKSILIYKASEEKWNCEIKEEFLLQGELSWLGIGQVFPITKHKNQLILVLVIVEYAYEIYAYTYMYVCV